MNTNTIFRLTLYLLFYCFICTLICICHINAILIRGRINLVRLIGLKSILWEQIVKKYDNFLTKLQLLSQLDLQFIDIKYLYLYKNIKPKMSKDQTDSHLRYGQGVIIKGYKPEKDPDQGYMTVRGFADTRANYETISDILYFKNYRNAIFQFLPAGNFQINDELYKLKSKIVENSDDEAQQNQTIRTLEARAKSEQAQFELGIKRKGKTTIKFGDYIMLRHIDSETYLSGTIRPSEGTNGAFSVEVSNRLSKSLVFQLLPYRSFEKESMEIPFSSPVLIKNVYNNGYLTFEKLGLNIDTSNQNSVMLKVPTLSDDTYKIPVKTTTKNSQVYQVVTHFVDLSIEQPIPMPWLFQLHFKEVENDSLIQHDVVYLRHTENNGILSAVGEDIVLKESKIEGLEGLHFYQSLWEIQKHTDAPRVYILRHLMSGMTLGVKKDLNNQPESAILIDISEGPGNCELGSIELKLAKKDGGQIDSQSFISICDGQFTLDIVPQEEEEPMESFLKSSINTFSGLVNLRKLKRLAKNQLEYNVKRLRFSSDISKNCFVIQQIEDTLKKELLFALSFHSTIINLREDLKWGATDSMKKVSYIRMMKVTQKISEINDFLKDCQANDPEKQFKQPLQKRQLICKDLGLSQLLFELLFYIRFNMNEQIFKEKPNEKQKFYEMHTTIYQVLIVLIKNNKAFKIHVSKWIVFIIEDFVEKGEEIHYQALMELLKGNSFFVQNFVSVQLIDYLLESMMKQKSQKSFVEKRYIDVLRAFCIVDDKVFSHNQTLILKSFIEKLEKSEESRCYQLKFIKQQNNQIYCRVALDKKNILQYKFQEFKTLCEEEDQNGNQKYPNSWQYYTAYLNLLADLTKGRNKSVEKYVANELPLELLSELFENYQIGQFQVPIIKILHYLYAENENFYPIDKEKRIVAYESIEESQITVNHFTGSISPWISMEKVLFRLLKKLQQSGPISPREYAQNQILYQLLKLTDQTLNLGFWMKKQELEQIFTNVLKILEKHPFIDYEQCKKICKENQLMILCKIECLNIIDSIIDQDMGISLQLCNKVFREFEIEMKDSSNENAAISNLVKGQEDISFSGEFNNKLQERCHEVEPIVNNQIYEQMLELSKYNNAALTSKSLSILYKILDYKQHRINNFYSQLFVCEPEQVMFAEFLTNLKNKFFILEDINTPKITYENQSENYFPIYLKQLGSYHQSQGTGIMQDMYMITELMKNQSQLTKVELIPNLDTSGVFARMGTESLINFTDCRKSSNIMKQKIVDATNIHNKILKYIVNCSQVPDSELALKLLHLCYKFLVGVIQNHQEMKHKIIPYLPTMLKHLPLNIGYIDLLRQIYDNNKNMLYNELEIQSLIRTICDQINRETNILYKAKLLDFFRYLIYLNSKCLRNNQILILKIMQDDDYTQILQNVTVNTIKKLVERYKEMNGYGQFRNEKVIHLGLQPRPLEDDETHDYLVRCEPELVYLSTYFQVISSLIDQSNQVNIGKLIKRLPFDLLTECIAACEDCWFLKRNIRAVINRMYYFVVGTNVYINTIIGKEIPCIIDDLDRFIATKLKSEEQVNKLESLVFQNPVRFTYLQSYFYLNLEENLFSIFSMLNTRQLYDQLAQYLTVLNEPSDFSNNMIRIAQRLGQIRKYFTKHQNIHTIAIIKFLQHRLKSLLEGMKIEIYEPGLKHVYINKIQRNSEEEERIKGELIERILEGDISQFYVDGSERYKIKQPLVYLTEVKEVEAKVKREKDEQKLNTKLRQIFTRKKRQFANRDEEIGYKKLKIVSALKMSKQVNISLIKAFENNLVECQSRGEKGKDQLLDYISILIKINEENPQIITQDLKIFILKIINSLFYQANAADIKQEAPPADRNTIVSSIKMGEQEEKVSNDKPAEGQGQGAGQQQELKEIDEWEAEDWQQNSSKITILQCKLKQCGVGSFVTSLIKGNILNNIKLANSILLCSISYMLGGNKITQNDIKEQLNKDPENKLLINIKKLIFKLGGLIRKNIDEEKNANKEEAYISDFFINYIDNYDFYDKDRKFVTRKNVSEPHYVDETLYYKECIVTYRRAFKFMQLLCENNNIENKNFIRQQPDTSQSIDFIEIATKELRNIFQVLCIDIAEVPIFILDFILEVTQIPVKLNQDALIRSSFFEDVCLLANTLSKIQEFKERGFEDNKQCIDEIFQKCVQIILSNLQGNNPDYLVLLDQKLDPNFLVKLFKEKLENIGIHDKGEFQSYIQKMIEPHTDENGNLNAAKSFDEEIVSILEILIIFMKLRDILGQQKSRVYAAYIKEKSLKDKHERKLNEELFETLEGCLLKIQINDSNNSTQDVYFPKHPVFNSISGGLKDYVMSQVVRQSHREKIVSLLGFVSGVRSKICQAYNFQKCEHISEQVMNKYYLNASNLSILICIYMILFYNVYIEYGGAEYTSSWLIVIVRFILSLLQFKYAIMYGYTWYKLKIWAKPQSQSRENKEIGEINVGAQKGAIEQGNQIDIKPYEQMNLVEKVKYQINTKIVDKLKETGNKLLEKSIEIYPPIANLVETLKSFKQSFSPEDPEQPKVQDSGQFYKIALFIGVSFFSVFIYPPLIFIHLVDRICSNPYLGNIFQAIGLVIKPLLYINLMGVAFVVVFSTVTFSNYMKDVYSDATDTDQMCNNTISCILALFVSGAISQTMTKFQIVRFVYDLIYGIFFGLLFGNIVSGFMLDAFQELGETADQLQTDKKDFCYVCNIKRERLEKNGQKFEDHISKKHHLWNYIFYIIALENKNETDYTGLEYYISQKYNLPDEEMDVTWIPNGEEVKFESIEFVTQLLKKLDETKDSANEVFKQLEAKIEGFTSLAKDLQKE